jgi:hypothetical protein
MKSDKSLVKMEIEKLIHRLNEEGISNQHHGSNNPDRDLHKELQSKLKYQ